MKKILTGLLISAIASPVMAGSKFYAGASYGNTENPSKSSFSIESQGYGFNDSDNFNGDSSSYSIRGGYYFYRNLAIEIGHYEYGKVTYAYTDDYYDTVKNNVVTNSDNVGLKAIWPITSSISFGTRVGLAKWNFDEDSTHTGAPGQVVTVNQEGADVYYGAGVEYNLNKSLSVGLEYSSLSMKWGSSESEENYSYKSDMEHKVNSVSLTALLKF